MPIQHGFACEVGDYRPKVYGEECLGAEEVHLTEEGLRVQYLRHFGTEHSGDFQQDTHTLAPLFAFQFADMIVRLHHLLRLDEDGLARGGLVVNDTANLAFVGGRHGQYQPPFAHGGSSIFVENAFSLRLTENAVEGTRDGAL